MKNYLEKKKTQKAEKRAEASMQNFRDDLLQQMHGEAGEDEDAGEGPKNFKNQFLEEMQKDDGGEDAKDDGPDQENFMNAFLSKD